MPNPLRTPTISPNNLISSAVSQVDQFRELFFQLKELFVQAGGTILLSNGGGVAGAGDNIANAAAVTTGLAGTGAWYVVEFANLGGSAFRLLAYVNDNAAPFQSVAFRGGSGTWAGGTTGSLPTLTGVAFGAHAYNQMHFSTTAVNVRWSTWFTANVGGAQSIKFGAKEGGSGQWSTWLVLGANSDLSGGGIGFDRWYMFIPGSGVPLSSISFINGIASWEGATSGGAASSSPVASARIWDISTSWPNGLNMQARQNLDSVLLGQPGATGLRELGLLVDTYAIPVNSTFGLWSDNQEAIDGQAFQRKNMGVVAEYWPAGADLL